MQAPASVWWDGSGKEELSCTVLDASTSGARLRIDRMPRSAWATRVVEGGETIVFRPTYEDAPHLERPVRAIVRKVFEDDGSLTLGVLFLPDQPMEVRETVAYLIFGSSDNWLNIRAKVRRKKGLLAGLGYVTWLALVSLPRTVADFMREPARRNRVALEEVTNRARPAHLVAFGASFARETEEEERQQAAARVKPAETAILEEAAG